MKYLFDTNIFITAKNTYYAMDIAKTFWEYLERDDINTKIMIIDMVYKEIKRGKDELATWMTKTFRNKIILSSSDAIITNYKHISEAISQNDSYTKDAKNEFARVADSWLIAHAYHNNNCYIVTNETYDANIKRRIKIPNVCKLFNIQCIDLFQFMRNEKIVL